MNEKIKKIIKNVLKLEIDQINSIDDDADLIMYGLDSLNAIEIIVNLENEFDIIVEDEDLLIENLSSINLLVKMINKYLEE